MAMSECFISIFLLLFEMKAAWDICRDYLLSKQQLSIERQEAERGFRKNLFKSCMYVYCIILMYTSEYVRVDFPSEVEVVGVQSVAAARRR